MARTRIACGIELGLKVSVLKELQGIDSADARIDSRFRKWFRKGPIRFFLFGIDSEAGYRRSACHGGSIGPTCRRTILRKEETPIYIEIKNVNIRGNERVVLGEVRGSNLGKDDENDKRRKYRDFQVKGANQMTEIGMFVVGANETGTGSSLESWRSILPACGLASPQFESSVVFVRELVKFIRRLGHTLHLSRRRVAIGAFVVDVEEAHRVEAPRHCLRKEIVSELQKLGEGNGVEITSNDENYIPRKEDYIGSGDWLVEVEVKGESTPSSKEDRFDDSADDGEHEDYFGYVENDNEGATSNEIFSPVTKEQPSLSYLESMDRIGSDLSSFSLNHHENLLLLLAHSIEIDESFLLPHMLCGERGEVESVPINEPARERSRSAISQIH
ncbi:hypothetical protein PIB30_046548 [Stylosanthes scabra]|uniref:Transposase n=1 Tax=Stylosanthes scabra TaxID=79078 RepID=A0ABU6UIB9_9FABA|nr:hypothetical protein [Stylosanthes scabra]